MSDSETTAPVENVTRGSLFALLTIPVALILFALIGGFLGLISGFIVIAIPFLANFLYVKGAGAPLSRAGWMPFILIAGVAVVLATFTSIVAATFNGFLSVGGDGGLLGAPFRTTLARTLTNLDDLMFPVLIGLLIGFGGIVSVVRGKNAQAKTAAVLPATTTSSADQQPVAPAANWQAEQSVAPPAVPTSPPVTPPNQPSPGVMLNGKPIDTGKK